MSFINPDKEQANYKLEWKLRKAKCTAKILKTLLRSIDLKSVAP